MQNLDIGTTRKPVHLALLPRETDTLVSDGVIVDPMLVKDHPEHCQLVPNRPPLEAFSVFGDKRLDVLERYRVRALKGQPLGNAVNAVLVGLDGGVSDIVESGQPMVGSVSEGRFCRRRRNLGKAFRRTTLCDVPKRPLASKVRKFLRLEDPQVEAETMLHDRSAVLLVDEMLDSERGIGQLRTEVPLDALLGLSTNEVDTQ